MKKMTSLSLSLGNGRPLVAIRERENLFIFMQFLEKGIPCFCRTVKVMATRP